MLFSFTTSPTSHTTCEKLLIIIYNSDTCSVWKLSKPNKFLLMMWGIRLGVIDIYPTGAFVAFSVCFSHRRKLEKLLLKCKKLFNVQDKLISRFVSYEKWIAIFFWKYSVKKLWSSMFNKFCWPALEKPLFKIDSKI